ncbi:response regulator transcription factor [uncultured Algoriphagus sp.]|uniref:LytR/AlgR family response regulator transcription factor n=1 Tax=uncultured Algoriphagus sp. TaxID=417365 RepID=UPI0030ECED49|tara:strand:- start:10881 stop:11684 length:804 start_codon:yes stop_codon:yes gene_type:complete
MIKLLIVEDDPFFSDLLIADLLSLYATGEIHLIGPAETYQEAISLIQSESPEIALLDINLGSANDFSGIRIAEFLNGNHPIPIIFLSGQPYGFEHAKYTLPVSFLRKPYRKQDLSDQLELIMVRLNMESKLKSDSNNAPKLNGKSIVFVTINRGELVPVHLDQLLFLEADGKIIKAHIQNTPYPIVFTSPGLKNFFDEHLANLRGQFFQISRKHVINTSQISRIKDNQVILQKVASSGLKTEFRIPFPANGDSKKALIQILLNSQNQ